jgi:hypothetical protein
MFFKKQDRPGESKKRYDPPTSPKIFMMFTGQKVLGSIAKRYFGNTHSNLYRKFKAQTIALLKDLR